MAVKDFYEVHCCPWPNGWTNDQCYKFLEIYHRLITTPDVRDKNVDKVADKLLNAIFEEPQVKMVKKAVDAHMASIEIVYTETIRMNFANLTDAIRRNGPAPYQQDGVYEYGVLNTPGLNLNQAQRVVLCTAMCRYVFHKVGP